MEQITVNAKALKEVLEALNGPGHYIRELQATRSLPGNNNPLNILMEEYNTAVNAYNAKMIDEDSLTVK